MSRIVSEENVLMNIENVNFDMGASDAKCLKAYSVTLGSVLIFVSVGGIGFSLFLLFGEPFANQTNQTYRPDFENIGGFLDANTERN